MPSPRSNWSSPFWTAARNSTRSAISANDASSGNSRSASITISFCVTEPIWPVFSRDASVGGPDPAPSMLYQQRLFATYYTGCATSRVAKVRRCDPRLARRSILRSRKRAQTMNAAFFASKKSKIGTTMGMLPRDDVGTKPCRAIVFHVITAATARASGMSCTCATVLSTAPAGCCASRPEYIPIAQSATTSTARFMGIMKVGNEDQSSRV